MKTSIKILTLILISTLLFSGCKKEEPGQDEASELTQNINQFIKDVMSDVYLWYKEIPVIDIRFEFDSKAYFDKLVFNEDSWSLITDDVQALENSFAGIEKTFGWSLAFGQFSDSEAIFALVEFVYPNTPAANEGFKRGDMIYKINNSDISDDNYTDLLFADQIACTFGTYTEMGMVNARTAEMTALELELDPVLLSKIIEVDGHKIGYFIYAQYIKEFNYSLDAVFQNFIDEGVQDVIVDLRYNPGGTTEAAQYLCSAIGPENVVDNGDVLVTFQWNDKYQDYWQRNGVMNQLELRFINTTNTKMGLNSVHFITGPGTASSAELTITGLKPYMDVTTVGDTTFGKYTASITLTPEDYYESENYYRDFDNWGLQPIILRYANSQRVTDFKNGFAPDILVMEDLIQGIPLGEKEEPLLKATIEDITGSEIIAKKSASIKPYKLFDRGFSRFDVNKRELVLDHIDKKLLLH